MTTKPKEKELAYYLTLFKIEGHETWHSELSKHRDGFDENRRKQGLIQALPKVTDKKVFRVDRITGEISNAFVTPLISHPQDGGGPSKKGERSSGN